MAAWKRIRWGAAVSIASLVIVVSFSAVAAYGGQAASGASTEAQPITSLHIDGQGIEVLILRDSEGQQRTFTQPGPTITLPPGDYVVQSVRLYGDLDVQSRLIPEDLRVAVGPNEPATLRVAAPLRQVVKVERQGPVMVLHYELIGQGGESYAISPSGGSQRPTFAIYRGNRQVTSGDFEFG